MSITIDQALAMAAALNSDTARLDTALLLCAALGCERSYLMTWPERLVSPEQHEAFLALMARRQLGEPVAYILGRQAFWTLDLEVSPATLIPRPETETLIEHALQLDLPEKAQVLDLGTGTGAIALALASERPDWRVTALDFSADALVVAQRNAHACGAKNVSFVQSDWYGALTDQRFHLIVSNPPYIDSEDEHLEQGDVRFEPLSALVAAEQGLADLQSIISQAPQYLMKHGWVMLEHGYQQGASTRELLTRQGFTQVRTLSDLNHLERISIGCWE